MANEKEINKIFSEKIQVKYVLRVKQKGNEDMKQYRKNQYNNFLKKLKGNYRLKGVDADIVINFIKNKFYEQLF